MDNITRNSSFRTTSKVVDSSLEHEIDLEIAGGDQGIHTEKDLLRGGRPAYLNSLCPRQMDSLTAACDTILPSIQQSGGITNEALSEFYSMSASMNGVPELIGGFMTHRLRHPGLSMLLVTLWFLSTCIGTLVICGRASLSKKFPYLQSFSQVERQKREEILFSWASSRFRLYQMLYKSLKYLTVLVFFSQVDEKNQNPAWKAIGYSGPAPSTSTATAGSGDGEGRQEEEKHGKECTDPLRRAIVDMEKSKKVILETLHKAGFHFSSLNHQESKQKSSSPSPTIVCDAVVVGSGCGGGVVAGAIAKAGYKVIVLEKGDYFTRQALSQLEGPSLDRMYEGAGLLTTENMDVLLLAGSTVGGGSAVNWSASIRTPPHILDEWCYEYELELFKSKAYKDSLDIVCERMGVQSEPIPKEGFNNEILRRGCHELGYPVSDIPRNSPSDHYCGFCAFGCKEGKKKGTHETWLVDLAESGNGVILPKCRALKVLHEEKAKGKRAVHGVIFEVESDKCKQGMTNERVYTVEAKVVVVACGSLNTPVILKKSGLKNPHIGKHLHLHPSVMAWGHFPLMNGWPEEEKKSYEGGILTAMSTAVANFNTSGYGALIQSPSLHPGLFSVLTPWVSGEDLKERMSKFPRTGHLYALARDKGQGEVTEDGTIKYQLKAEDEKNLRIGMEKLLRILTAAGAEEIGTHHIMGEKLNVKKASSHEFERFIKRVSKKKLRDGKTPLCSAHQLGSCRMGVNESKSAVNERGETWEVEGLYVADASVLPTALGVNPMVTVLAISYCTAQSVIEVLRRKKTISIPATE